MVYKSEIINITLQLSKVYKDVYEKINVDYKDTGVITLDSNGVIELMKLASTLLIEHQVDEVIK